MNKKWVIFCPNIGEHLREKIRISIMMKVNKVIEEYAKKHHYTVVLPKGIVLYSDNAVDIIEDIIKVLNKNL